MERNENKKVGKTGCLVWSKIASLLDEEISGLAEGEEFFSRSGQGPFTTTAPTEASNNKVSIPAFATKLVTALPTPLVFPSPLKLMLPFASPFPSKSTAPVTAVLPLLVPAGAAIATE